MKTYVGDGWVLGPVRVVIGAILVWYALGSGEELANVGYFGDSFHMPMIPEALVPSHRAYTFLVAARVCLAVMITIGVWARPALALSSVALIWTLLSDRLQGHHNRYCLACFAMLLAMTPCDRSWRAAIDGPAIRTGSFWAVRLAQLQVSLVYLVSGSSNLFDADWRDGLVLGDRIATYGPIAIERGVPASVVHALGDGSSALAKLIIMTELFLCVALWLKPLRVVALWCGVWFHIIIQITTKVETFTVLTLALYGLFATPDFRCRSVRFDPSRLAGKLTGVLVPLLDWLARFDVKPWEPDDTSGHSVVVVRRDGTRVTGIRAFTMLTRCLPLLFPFWAPVALLASFTRQGDLTTRG